MKVVTAGHEYLLKNFEDGQHDVHLQFIHKEKDGDELVTIHDGTTNEEVIEVLLDRLNFLNSKFPCRENAVAITKLDEALMWLNKRTADRLKRGVEGQHKA